MLIAMTGTVSNCLHPCLPPPNSILDSAKQQRSLLCGALVWGGKEWARGQLECEKDPSLSDSPFQQPTHKMHIIAFSTVGCTEIQKVKSRICPIISLLSSSVRHWKSIFMNWVARVWGRLFRGGCVFPLWGVPAVVIGFTRSKWLLNVQQSSACELD